MKKLPLGHKAAKPFVAKQPNMQPAPKPAAFKTPMMAPNRIVTPKVTTPKVVVPNTKLSAPKSSRTVRGPRVQFGANDTLGSINQSQQFTNMNSGPQVAGMLRPNSFDKMLGRKRYGNAKILRQASLVRGLRKP